VKYTITQGILHPARFVPSPHCDARPLDVPVDLIVVHGISLPPGQFETQYIEDFFVGKILDTTLDPYFASIAHLRVSAHLLIGRDGLVIQFVPFTKRAWHAGTSSFVDREKCNDFSIGIELVGADDLPYTDPQYDTLSEIIPVLSLVYPAITHDRIVGHSDIAPGRKTDPGPAFDWNRLHQLVQLKQGIAT